MGFFDFIKRSEGLSPFAFRSGNEELVSPDLAMKCGVFYRCLSVISESVGCLPLKYKRLNSASGCYTDATDEPLFNLLTKQPNSGITAFEFIKSIVQQRILFGNAYILIEGSPNIERLILLSPHTVNYNNIAKTYAVNDYVNGITGTFNRNNIIHIKNTSLGDPEKGVSTVTYAANCLGLDSIALTEQKRIIGTGGRMRGFLKGADTGGVGKINRSQLKTASDILQDSINNRTADVIPLPKETEFQNMSMSPKDIEILSSRKLTEGHICQFMGVPPEKAFCTTGGNYKSSDNAQISFLTETLRPVLTQIEQEFSIKLIPFYLNDKYKLEFDISKLYTSDLTTESSYFKSMIECGAMTPNEIRQKKGLAPVEGGNELFISANVKPVKDQTNDGKTNT